MLKRGQSFKCVLIDDIFYLFRVSISIAESAAILHKAIRYVCEALANCETHLNQLDTQSGDGDCGLTLKRGADGLLHFHLFLTSVF